MFDYPKQAELNRILPKNKIYEFAKPNRALRDRFVSQVSEIVWKYKLSPETVHLPARHGIQEIQVFVITLKTGELSEDVLRTMDKTIPSPIFFQQVFGSRVKFSAAYKRPSDSGASKNVVNVYFETPWEPIATPRSPLPIALDLAGLYEQMLLRHATIPSRQGEPLPTFVDRLNQIRNKENECRQLEARLSKEIQFNRKVELNAELRLRKSELDQLQKP
jgi:hypothetical protein